MEKVGRQNRGKTNVLEEPLFNKGHRFDFFQAVRLLEHLYPDKDSVGTESKPGREAVRFKSNPALAFQASAIKKIEKINQQVPNEMLVNFMGLAGATGPLPYTYTELLLERISKKDFAMRDFLDVFNHRLISLLYQVRKKSRVGFEYVSPEQGRFAKPLASICGLNTKGLQNRMNIPDRSLFYFSGLLSQKPASVKGLETILKEYFRIKVKILEFQGDWIYLEEDQWTKIGKCKGSNNCLGANVALGTKLWDQQNGIQLELGPLSWEQLLDFLPDKEAYLALYQWLVLYLGKEYSLKLKLLIEDKNIPQIALSEKNEIRLGQTSWIKSKIKKETYSEQRSLNLTVSLN